MIPRQTVYQGDAANDDTRADPPQTVGELANAAVTHHTKCVREWLAAPANERAYFYDRAKAAWRDVRTFGMATESAAARAANGLMRAKHKLRGNP